MVRVYPLPAELASPVARPEPIVNGLPVVDFASVAFYTNGAGDTIDLQECSAVLVGCRTVLTAAHCICFEFDPIFNVYDGEECRQAEHLVGPGDKWLYFHHGGLVKPAEIIPNPEFDIELGHDLVVIRLARPVVGVRPSALNRTALVPVGSSGVIAGFGRTHGEVADEGIKRAGGVVTSECPGGLGETHVCWELMDPPGPPGEDSGICFSDSGGPLFTDFGTGPVVSGLAWSGPNPTCQPPSAAYDIEVFRHRNWIEETAGADLGTGSCGDLPPAFEPGTRVDAAMGEVSPDEPRAELTFEVSPGTRFLRVTLNGQAPAVNDLDLFVKRGAPASPDGSADCAGTREGALESCEVHLPAPGTWHVLVERVAGAAEFQLVATQWDQEEPPPPEPPQGPWLASPGLPGFEAKVRITAGGASVAGSAESGCIAETLCVSGALAGRLEVFVKVIGPRPNGYLWVQVSRFTPSRVELWVRRIETGQVRFYVLDPVGPGSDDVSGLQDREAFLP